MMSPGVLIFTFENMLYMEHWNLKIIWGQFSLFCIMNYLFQNNNNKKFRKKQKNNKNTTQGNQQSKSIQFIDI